MEDHDVELHFHEMELDDRLLKAIARLGWIDPTLIQEKAIPLLLEGKDVLVKARTGSGKTGAFAIPIIQKVLNYKQIATKQGIVAVILAPTRELCKQIHSVVKDLIVKCTTDVASINIGADMTLNLQKPMLMEKPDIVVSTPSRLLEHLKAGNLDLKQSLQIMVIDEADLVFSFGYEKEFKELVRFLPKIYQAVLSSATLSDDVNSLKKLILHNPVTLKLEEPDLASTQQLSHYVLMAEEFDKVTLLYTILKLGLIRGKIIIFVNTVDKCYKIKLYLEHFGIKTCVLNSELPATIRCHSVNQFNNGLYDIIIASDERALAQPGLPAPDGKSGKKQQRQKSKRKKDKESGVSRGIDFQDISTVINLDFPLDVSSYIHRAGRTARGDNEGNALSFVSMKEMEMYERVNEYLKKMLGEDGEIFKKYEFNVEDVESFRYRASDAWRSVTRFAVREARLKEIKQELFNCEKLKGYFADNPNDLNVLRHDKGLHTVRVQEHLRDVPDYIVPEELKDIVKIQGKPKKRKNDNKSQDRNMFKKRRNNPLMSMKYDGFRKKGKQHKKQETQET